MTSTAVLASAKTGKDNIPSSYVASMYAKGGGARLDAIVVWTAFEHVGKRFATFDKFHAQRVVFLDEVSRELKGGEEVKCKFNVGGEGDAYEIFLL